MPRPTRATPVLLVGGVIVAAALVYTLVGARSRAWGVDEAFYTQLAQHVSESGLGALFEWDIYQRGTQRLTVWLLAPGFALWDSPGAFYAGHLVQSLAFASAAIPVYRVARGLGLRPLWAAAPAAMSLAVPWAIVATTFLTEPVAYAAFMWLVYATFTAVAEPRPRNDALALVATAVALLSRTSYLTLLPLAPLAALVVAGPRGMWRAHRVLVVASTVALVAVALWSATGGGLRTLAGSYALPDFGDLGGVADKELAWLARVVAGTGYVTAVFALPWLAKGLVRRQAFSVVAVLAAGALLVSLADAAPDERYVMGLAPLLAIAAVAAVARREVRLAGTLVALVACVALVLSERWDLHLGAFAFFAFPAESLHRELVLGRLSVPPLSWLPGGTDLALALLMAAAVAIALVALRRRGAAAVIVALLVVVQLGAGAYALRKFDEQVGAPTPLSLSRRAFVDRHARGAEWAAVWDIGVGELPESIGQYRDAQFWNTRLRGDVTENGIVKAAYQYQLARHTQLAVDPSTGAARSAQGPTPPLLLVPRGFNALALVWRTRDRPYLPFDLVEPRRPLQAAWRVTHAELDGRVRAGQRARVRIFRAAGAAHACGLLAVQAPPGGGDAWPYRARIAGRTSAGRVAEAEPRVVAIPVSPRRPHTDAVVWSPRRDLLLAGMSIGPCP